MDYKPGDVANGHVLGSDNVWHPLSDSHASQEPSRETYLQRYRRRWKKTALVLACLTALSTYSRALAPDSGGSYGGAALVIDLVIAVIVGAVINGSLVNLVVAAFPSRPTTAR